MIPSYLSPFLNHLWQSTLVAAVAGTLALALRRNHARARHWVWLVASVKFLLPFSLLVAIGSHLGWSSAPAGAAAGLSDVVEQISQPFASTQPRPVVPTAGLSVETLISTILFAVWFLGCAAVLLRWFGSWRRIQAAVRAGSPLEMDAPVRVLSTSAAIEPGVFGIFRPVMLLPEGITAHLAPAQLKAILAHEICHIRRGDNLAAAIHMLVEAVFWFHPLVWWIGARLVEERERACDEEVLKMGSEPQVYAESILKTCEFYVESPLACMSGVTGADLKQRIVRIMTHRIAYNLSFGRKLLLAGVALAAVAGPIAYGVGQAPQNQAPPPSQTQTSSKARPTFEVASIKPSKPGRFGGQIRDEPGGRFTASNMPIRMLITIAYNIQPFQLTGGPSWLASDRYDIEATPERTGDDKPGKDEDRDPRREEQRLRLQALLVDRFKLTFHRETKELPIYSLVVAKSGPKLQPSADNGGEARRGMMMGFGELRGSGATVAFLVNALSRQIGRTVIDKTGLKGTYDFDLKYTPDQSQGPGGPFGEGPGPGPMGKDPPPPDPNGPTIFTALQEQLGLKLEPQKGPVEILVIDHIEKPSEN